MTTWQWLVLGLAGVSCAINAAGDQPTGSARYHRTATGFVMQLHAGADVFAEIETLVRLEQMADATFLAIGPVRGRIGIFDAAAKTYRPKDLPPMQLAGFAGSVAWENGSPAVHAHGILPGDDTRATGGHLIGAEASGDDLEVSVVRQPPRVTVQADESIETMGPLLR